MSELSDVGEAERRVDAERRVAVRDGEADRGQAVARRDRERAAQQRAADAGRVRVAEDLGDPRAAERRLAGWPLTSTAPTTPPSSPTARPLQRSSGPIRRPDMISSSSTSGWSGDGMSA